VYLRGMNKTGKTSEQIEAFLAHRAGKDGLTPSPTWEKCMPICNARCIFHKEPRCVLDDTRVLPGVCFCYPLLYKTMSYLFYIADFESKENN
jgi:hypothetical protein